MTNILIWALNTFCGWHIGYDEEGPVVLFRPDAHHTKVYPCDKRGQPK